MGFAGCVRWGSHFRSLGQLMLAVALIAPAVWGQTEPAAGKGKLLTPEASLNLRSISDLQPFSDGTRLAFVVTEPAQGTDRGRHIWVYDKGAGATRQLPTRRSRSRRLGGRLTGNNWLSVQSRRTPTDYVMGRMQERVWQSPRASEA